LSIPGTPDGENGRKWIDLDVQPSLCWNLEEFNKSRRKILEVADYIIPGHGRIFKIN